MPGVSRSICGPTMRDSSSEVNYPGVRAVAIIQPHHQSRHRGMVLSRDPAESRNEPTLPINQPHHQSRHCGMVLAAIQWLCLSSRHSIELPRRRYNEVTRRHNVSNPVRFLYQKIHGRLLTNAVGGWIPDSQTVNDCIGIFGK